MMDTFENFIHDKYGYCYYCVKPYKNPIIYNLYTEPKYRMQGHAKRHLEFVIREIRATGYTGIIEVQVRPRENSISPDKLTDLYNRLGLTIIQ